MRSDESRHLREALAPYLRRSSLLAWTLLLATLAVYAAAVAGALALPSLAARLAASVLAGSAISSLFVIGHDAAHGAYTASRRTNALIGRIAFLPALHNYSLWQVQHNRLHHRIPNVRGFNSWSPMTKAEYDALPAWRRWVERLYRGPLGFAPYYLVERWWKDKFFPRRPQDRRPIFWFDFALLLGFLAGFLALLALAGLRFSGGALPAVLLGFALPYVVWSGLMGATTYMQHTHPRVAWFEAIADWRRLGGQQDVTVHLQVPRWYGLISHHIMDHPVHHVHPKIPLYRLSAAQRRLNELLGERAVKQRFSPGYLFGTVARCKLYDFQRHCWLDFAGRPTSSCTLPEAQHEALEAVAAAKAAYAA